MKVLLVGSSQTIWGFDTGIRLPNLGLASLAGNVDRNIAEVKIADLIVSCWDPHSYLKRLISKFRPDVLGLSSMVFQYNNILEFARAIKQLNPHIKIVLGGYLPTVNHQEILNSTDMQYFDFLIRGEGELAFNQLIKSLSYNQNLQEVPNLSYLSNGNIINNTMTGLADLNTIALPDREARILKRGFYIAGLNADVIETSRGCVFGCNYCSIQQMYGKSFRKYNIDRVIRDIRATQKYNVKSLFIVDDNITLDGHRYRDLCQAITAEGLNKIVYSVQADIRGIKQTPGLVAAMAKAGTKWVFLGIENESIEALRFMNKDSQFSRSATLDVVRELKEYGIFVIGGFILGHPDDSEKTIWANFEYARELGVDIAYFFLLTPYPGTVIREKLIEQGMVTNLHDYSRYTGFDACVKTKYLSAEQLNQLRDEIGYRWYPSNNETVKRIFKYIPKSFILKLVTGQMLKAPGEVKEYLKRSLFKLREKNKKTALEFNWRNSRNIQ
jgi:anaerobic magnesium-protoporphyrin IX monomethyl ester cyclase